VGKVSGKRAAFARVWRGTHLEVLVQCILLGHAPNARCGGAVRSVRGRRLQQRTPHGWLLRGVGSRNAIT
jgi:hypothetical protein